MVIESPVRSDDLRNANRWRVLNTLRTSGPCSQSALALATGLSAAAISSLINQMVEQSILLSSRCAQQAASGRGRPQSRIELNPRAADAITLNITINQLTAQRVSYTGELRFSAQTTLRTRDVSPEELIDIATGLIEELLQKDGQTKVELLGVAFQGVVENTSGDVIWSPIIQHKNMPLQSLLSKRLNLPVSVNNDSYLVSEALSDCYQETLGDSFATVLFSQGVGFSLHLEGKGFCGIESSALELGHLRFERKGALCRCGRYGCIEAYASDYGIVRLATGDSIEDDPLGRINAQQIGALGQAATCGDESAIQAFAVAGAALGEGLLTVFTLFDTMPVALVGRTRIAFDLMRPGLSSVLRHDVADVRYMDEHLHCFDDAESLLQLGLAHNTLSKLDNEFAHTNLVVRS